LESLKDETQSKKRKLIGKNGGMYSSSSSKRNASLHMLNQGIPTDYASQEIRVLETRYFEVLSRLRQMEAPKAKLTTEENRIYRVLPGGRSTHRDTLIAEMKWMANDFHGERRWKRNANLHVSDAIAKYHLDKEGSKRRRVVVSDISKKHVRRHATTTNISKDSIGSVTDALSVAETVRDVLANNNNNHHHNTYQNLPKSQRLVKTWLLNLQSRGLGACLLDSLKKGGASLRSEEIVCAYFRDFEQDLPHLIVLSNSTRFKTWQTLLRRMCPKRSVTIAKSTSDTLFADRYDVVLVSESCLAEDKRIRHGKWHTVVFDEPSILSNSLSATESWTRFDRLYEVATCGLTSLILTQDDDFKYECGKSPSMSTIPSESTIRMALLFPRLFLSDTSFETSKKIVEWYEREGKSSSKNKKSKTSVFQGILALLEIRRKDIPDDDNNEEEEEEEGKHVLVSCPLSTQQCQRFPSLTRYSDSKTLVSDLNSLRRLSNCPPTSFESKIRSSFVQSESLQLRIPDLRSKSHKMADLSFLGLAFTHNENRNISIYSQRLHVYSSTSRSFTILPNRERVSTVSVSAKASLRLMPYSLVAEISSPPLYVDDKRFSKKKHKNYVNWFRCTGTRLIYGKNVRDIVRSNLSEQQRSHVQSVAPDLLRLVTNYASSKRCKHLVNLTVSRSVATRPRLVSSKIPRHVQEKLPFMKCNSSINNNTLYIPHPVDSMRGSTKFSRALEIVRWHRERGGKCVVVLRDSSLVSCLSTWFTAHRVGNVISMCTKSVDTLNRCLDTCVLLTSSSSSDVVLPPLMDITALIFVDFENVDYTKTVVYQKVTRCPWRPLVVYRLVSTISETSSTLLSLSSPTKSSKKAGKRRKKSSKATTKQQSTKTTTKKKEVYPENRNWWNENVLDAACECVEKSDIVTSPLSYDSILESESDVAKAWKTIAGSDEAASSRGRKRKAPSKNDGDISANDALALALRLVPEEEKEEEEEEEEKKKSSDNSSNRLPTFIVKKEDVTTLKKRQNNRLHQRSVAHRLTYDVPPILSHAKTFDGVRISFSLSLSLDVVMLKREYIALCFSVSLSLTHTHA
jgi:hypothetical protein